MKGQPRDRALQRKLREKSLTSVDIVDEVVRLCGMNLYLHGIVNGESLIRSADALGSDPGERYNVVLTNPPFGRKSSYRVIGDGGAVGTEREDYARADFKFTTSNKQLNFLQHVMTILGSGGRAAVVLPNNVLFEAGSAGEGSRKRLLMQFDFHTLMRLPAWTISTACRHRTRLRPRSWKTCRRRWSGLQLWPKPCGRRARPWNRREAGVRS